MNSEEISHVFDGLNSFVNEIPNQKNEYKNNFVSEKSSKISMDNSSVKMIKSIYIIRNEEKSPNSNPKNELFLTKRIDISRASSFRSNLNDPNCLKN